MIIRKVYSETCFGLRGERYQTMNNLLLPCASFTHAQLTLLKIAAFYFDKLYLLDSVRAGRATIGEDHNAYETDRPDLHPSGFAGDFKL
jgi:hypothetical protein